MASALEELDRLATLLGSVVAKTTPATAPDAPPVASTQPPRPPDAIDQVLAEPPSTTATVSLRDAPEMDKFRQALNDGLIENDAARQLLSMVNNILTKVLIAV